VETEPFILAVDLGTSALKTAFDLHFREAGWLGSTGNSPARTPQRRGGTKSVGLVGSVPYHCKRLIQKELVPVENIIAVCCSTQGECTVPVDADGRL